jgi:hypothetical protein
MIIAQNESSQQGTVNNNFESQFQNISLYQYSKAQKQIATDLVSHLSGHWGELYWGAQEILSGEKEQPNNFIQQSLYISTAIMGLSTQNIYNFFPCHWYICIGESGSGKSLCNEIIAKTLIKLRNKCWPVVMPASREGLYTIFDPQKDGYVPNPNIFLDFDEGLGHLHKLWPSYGAELPHVLSPLIDTLLKSYGPCSFLPEITNKDPAKSSKRVESPRIGLTTNGQNFTIATSDRFLDKGFYQRSFVFDFVGKIVPKNLDSFLDAAESKNISTELAILDKYWENLNKSFPFEFSLQTKIRTYAKKGRLPNPTVGYDFHEDYSELMQYLNKGGHEAHAKALTEQYQNRLTERFVSYAWLHAWGAGRLSPNEQDTTVASLFISLHYQNILNRMLHMPKNNPHDYDLITYIYQCVINKPGLTRSYITKRCSANNAYKKFSSQNIDRAIAFLVKESQIAETKTAGCQTSYRPGKQTLNTP